MQFRLTYREKHRKISGRINCAWKMRPTKTSLVHNIISETIDYVIAILEMNRFYEE